MKRFILDRDFLTALVLFGIGGVFLSNSGDDLKDWIFPLLATYVALGIAVALVLLVIFRAIMNRLPDILHLTADERIAYFDVLVFFLIVLAYILVMRGIGFWLSSLLMVTLTSINLTLEKTRHNMMLALVVPLLFCIVAFFVFTHVFYVPFPKGTWWPDLG